MENKGKEHKQVLRGSNATVRKEVKMYCAAHPGSPPAVRHPRIVVDHGRYVALLGRSNRVGVIGFGTSVASALHAFDDLYTRTYSH